MCAGGGGTESAESHPTTERCQYCEKGTQDVSGAPQTEHTAVLGLISLFTGTSDFHELKP